MASRFFEALNWLPRRYGRIVASGQFVPQIDGLRFLAIFQVMIYHAALRGQRVLGLSTEQQQHGLPGWLPNGAAGVELFFFISGYIIALPFLAGRAPSLGKFFRRRLLRLEPPYMVALLLCFLALAAVGFAPGNAPGFAKTDAPVWQSLLASMIYSHGLIFQAPPRLNPPLWSLEIEIQFYILAPLILAGYLMLKRRATRVAFGIAVIVALIPAQVLLGRVDHFFDFTLLTHGYAFFIGIVICDLAIARNPLTLPASRLFDAALVIGIVLLFASGALFYPTKGTILPAMATLVMRAAAILLIYYGAMRGVAGRKVMSLPWLTFLGGACYSIYLTHVPVMQTLSGIAFRFVRPHSVLEAWALSPALLIPPAIVAGIVFYLVIERPCMDANWPSKLAARFRRDPEAAAAPEAAR